MTGHIIWHGRVALSDLPSYYAASDVFVLPRLSRVTPRVLFEAMSSGLPVIASEVGGVGEFIDQGRTGLTVNPRHPEEIATRIVQVLQDRELALSLGAAARQYASRELAWPVIVQRIRTEVYAALVPKEASAG